MARLMQHPGTFWVPPSTTKATLLVRPRSLSVPFPGTLRRSHHPRVFRGEKPET